MKTISLLITDQNKRKLQKITDQTYTSMSSYIKKALHQTDLKLLQISKLSKMDKDVIKITINADEKSVLKIEKYCKMKNIAKSTLLTSIVIESLEQE